MPYNPAILFNVLPEVIWVRYNRNDSSSMFITTVLTIASYGIKASFPRTDDE
jgi:hypothetical protein